MIADNNNGDPVTYKFCNERSGNLDIRIGKVEHGLDRMKTVMIGILVSSIGTLIGIIGLLVTNS